MTLLMTFTDISDLNVSRYATRAEAEIVGKSYPREKGLAYLAQREDDLLGFPLNGDNETISSAALTELYNAFSQEPVRRFANRTTASSRVARLLNEKFADAPIEERPKVSEVHEEIQARPADNARSTTKDGRVRRRKGEGYNWVPSAEVEPKKFRASSKTGQILADLLTPEGMSQAELCQKYGMTEFAVYCSLASIYEGGYSIISESATSPIYARPRAG